MRRTVGTPDAAMAQLFPALAYPIDVIDPYIDAHGRDDGEPLLQRLRALWRAATRHAARMLDPDYAHGVGARLAGHDVVARKRVLDGILKADAVVKPRVRLVAPRVGFFKPEAVDQQLDEEQRVETIPVKDERLVAILNWPMHPPARVIYTFSRGAFGLNGRQDAVIELERSGPLTIEAVFNGVGGTSTRLTLSLSDVLVVDRAFARVSVAAHAIARELLPTTPGELPAAIAIEVADFLQTGLRGHVLVAAAQPPTHASERTFCFSSMTVRIEGRNDLAKKLTLRATLHPSSCECACPVHTIRPIGERFPHKRFTSSRVEFVLTMCGRPLEALPIADGQAIYRCPLHTVRSSVMRAGIPRLCTQAVGVSLSCAHFANREFHPGLYVRDIPLDIINTAWARTLLAHAFDCVERTTPVLTKRKRTEDADLVKAELRTVCADAVVRMHSSLSSIERQRALRPALSSVEQLELDAVATHLLRTGLVRQYRRRTTRELVLARKVEGRWVPLTAHEAKLNADYAWLFPPPL